ncbi:MAG: putative toxin-antitoxin system toxin component, PIN family [Spirosomataceae bacterium]
MKIVIDTNALLATLPKISPYRLVLNKIFTEEIELVVSTAIILEYQEVITFKTNAVVAHNFLEFILNLPSVTRLEAPFQWWLITSDPDDNKFVDVALIANADYLVTNDKHFNVLKSISFPKIQVISLDEFMAILTEWA